MSTGSIYKYLQGVINRNQELDALITPELDRPIAELSPVEHAALLIGAYELAADLSVPYKVAINEAVELTKTFGGRMVTNTSMAYLTSLLKNFGTLKRTTDLNVVTNAAGDTAQLFPLRKHFTGIRIDPTSCIGCPKIVLKTRL